MLLLQTKGLITKLVEALKNIRLLLAELAVDLTNHLIDAELSTEGTMLFVGLDLLSGDVNSSGSSDDINNEEPLKQYMPWQGNCQFRDMQQMLL